MERPQRKPNRLPQYDYSRAGYYFITVCVKNREPLLWELPVGATCGRPPLSPLGMIVEEELRRLDHMYAHIGVDKFVIMPNHIHLILQIRPDGCGRPQVAPTISRVMKQFKGVVTKRAGLSLWQKSFHDHVIRSEADYLRVWNYIDVNPARWVEDEYFREDTP